MTNKPRIGKVGTQVYCVESAHLIDFLGDDAPGVLATPWLIGFLERTARLTVADDLDPGEVTVGVEISVKHLAPTPAGQDVTCTARVIGTDDGMINFQLEAHDNNEKIAQGFHRRRAIKIERFVRYVKRKAGRT